MAFDLLFLSLDYCCLLGSRKVPNYVILVVCHSGGALLTAGRLRLLNGTEKAGGRRFEARPRWVLTSIAFLAHYSSDCPLDRTVLNVLRFKIRKA